MDHFKSVVYGLIEKLIEILLNLCKNQELKISRWCM